MEISLIISVGSLILGFINLIFLYLIFTKGNLKQEQALKEMRDEYDGKMELLDSKILGSTLPLLDNGNPLGAKIEIDSFNSNPEEGLVQIFEEHTSNAIVFMAYNHTNDNKPPIIYSERLAHEINRKFTGNLTEKERTSIYEEFSEDLLKIIIDLNSQFSILKQGVLERVVFDADHGGIFYYQISSNEYICGITLNQQKIFEADNEMRQVGQIVQAYLGLNITIH